MRKQRYHVHIYEIRALAELPVAAPDEEAARRLALDLAKNDKLIFGESDNRFIAIAFKEPDVTVPPPGTRPLIEKVIPKDKLNTPLAPGDK